MNTQGINEWLKQARESSLSDAEIYLQLQNSGWDKIAIEKLLSRGKNLNNDDLPIGIAYHIDANEFASRLSLGKYKMVPVFALAIVFFVTYAYFDAGREVAKNLGIVGALFLLSGVLLIKFKKPEEVDLFVELNKEGVHITKNKDSKHYSWNLFTTAMTNTEFGHRYTPQSLSNFGFGGLAGKSAEISEEMHGKIFFLIYEKESVIVEKQYLVLYTKQDNYNEVEKVLYHYLPRPK
ncbi:MAG: hypothetical protein WC544_01750 [Patescibacteria group bacterium]